MILMTLLGASALVLALYYLPAVDLLGADKTYTTTRTNAITMHTKYKKMVKYRTLLYDVSKCFAGGGLITK